MMVNIHSRKFLRGSGNTPVRHSLSPRSQQRLERNMRKIVLAAVAAMAVAAPSIASAQGFSVRVGGDRDTYRDRDYGGPRVGVYEHDRGWHRAWGHHDYDGDRGVVIHRYHYDD
jgi:hypothetical protein